MSWAGQFISIDIEDPQYYADLLLKIPRTANRRLSSDGQSFRNVPGIQKPDITVTRRLQALLDAVADISLFRRGNVSATMASIKDNAGTLETQMYIVFNHENDESAGSCSQHLQSIFNMLREVKYIPLPPATGGSPKVIAKELEDSYVEICRAIHDYSYDVFLHRITKREHKLSEIRGYIEQDQTSYFSDKQREVLLKFLYHVDTIITMATTITTEQFPTNFIKMLLGMYTYWSHNGLLPKDSQADKRLTLLDNADAWLTENHNIRFQLQRWALKIMSFVISANRLIILTQSLRLREIIHGNFSVQVLNSGTAIPYRCHLSSETIQAALDAAVAETGHILDDWDNKCKWFIEQVLGRLKEPVDMDHSTPTVHAELAMIIATVKGEIKDVLPYIGVSKLSCTMCSHYIGAFNQVCKQNIVTKGSHGKAYPGWSWPRSPDRDEELRRAFLGQVRRQLLDDFEVYVERRLSDSSVGSGRPEWEISRTSDEIDELIAAARDM